MLPWEHGSRRHPGTNASSDASVMYTANSFLPERGCTGIASTVQLLCDLSLSGPIHMYTHVLWQVIICIWSNQQWAVRMHAASLLSLLNKFMHFIFVYIFRWPIFFTVMFYYSKISYIQIPEHKIFRIRPILNIFKLV